MFGQRGLFEVEDRYKRPGQAGNPPGKLAVLLTGFFFTSLCKRRSSVQIVPEEVSRPFRGDDVQDSRASHVVQSVR